MAPNKIIALEENVIRQIAAGEVVERPASVVKELLENSLDAGSRRIALEIEGSGKELLRVSDDGCGLDPGDARLALQRHTTSKIRRFEDLSNLQTFGFRGEALPSISSVSQMEIFTKSPESPHGWSIAVDGGNIISEKECGRDQGTTITVKNIFFNVPVRLKFLKSDATEKSKILKAFEETALAHPQVSFSLKSSTGKAAEYPARTELLARIEDLWGTDFNKDNMFPVFLQHPNLKIEGWLSKPQFHQASRSFQVFYVNERPIVSRPLTHALYEAYSDCLPVGRNPAAVIFLTLAPSEVDVNVHPAKREVRFRNESQIYGALLNEIRLKRSQLSSSPLMFSGVSTETPAGAGQETINPMPFIPDAAPGNLRHGLQGSYGVKTNGESFSLAEKARVLAQFNALYVLAEKDGDLVIVDQHAASERVFYEKYKKAVLSGKPVDTQMLLIPLIWNVTMPQAELLRTNIKSFQRLGYALDEFGEKTFRVTETPALLPEAELKNTLDEILRSLEDSGETMVPVDEKIISTSACRAAIKANDVLTVKELSELLEQLSLCDNPHTCPHGRPTSIKISRQELDKKFGRI